MLRRARAASPRRCALAPARERGDELAVMVALGLAVARSWVTYWVVNSPSVVAAVRISALAPANWRRYAASSFSSERGSARAMRKPWA
jgi:hypothetical protein